MQYLTLKANITTEKEIEIPIPFFAKSKDDTNYIGLLDENTVVRIFKGISYTSVSNSNMDFAEKSKLLEAWENWHSCTESAFLEKYDEVIESISLHPKLAV